MKRIISISLISVAALILSVFAILPHHHHDGLACIAKELCEQDDVINDEHTYHHSDASGETCIAESEFISPQFNNDTKCKVSSCNDYNHNHIQLFPVYFLVANLLNFDIENSFLKPDYGEYIFFCKSAETNQYHGLRAPPFFS